MAGTIGRRSGSRLDGGLLDDDNASTASAPE